jgi:hypothetical protein
MKLHLPLLALLPLASGCIVAAAAGAGYVVSQQVLPNHVHVAQVAYDVEHVWPSVKETLGFYQAPGSEFTVQDFPRSVKTTVDGAKVIVEVEAIDLDRTTIRVSAEKYLTKDNATAQQVMSGILERLEK